MKYDLGFLGGGQLARMSIQAAQRMGLRCVSLDPAMDCCAGQIADHIQGNLDDPEAISRVIEQSGRVTLENEFIPARAIRAAFEHAKRDERALTPGTACLEVIQDKLLQREAMNRAGVPSPNAAPIRDPASLLSRLTEDAEFSPVVLKSRFGGYDGKGVRPAHSLQQFASILDDLGDRATDWLLEDFVPFQRELAVMVFVSPTHKGAYPTMETVQSNHVCDLVFPCDAYAAEIAIAAVEAVGGHGLFGVELFQLENRNILVNEIAPRPHNTGHYTLDWGGTSQFEQHVRLAMGFPIDPSPKGRPTCMANLLGGEGALDLSAATARALAYPETYVHWYGKSPRPGRKVGHINSTNPEGLVFTAIAARKAFFSNDPSA